MMVVNGVQALLHNEMKVVRTVERLVLRLA